MVDISDLYRQAFIQQHGAPTMAAMGSPFQNSGQSLFSQPDTSSMAPVMQMASASRAPAYEPTTGSEMEADSRSSIDKILERMQASQEANHQNDRNMQWMSFFSKLASSKNPSLLGGLGEGAEALTETTGKQAQTNKLLEQAALQDELKLEQWKQDQALKKEENVSQAKLRDAQSKYYGAGGSGGGGGAPGARAQRYMDEMNALGTPVTFIQALAATSPAGTKNLVANTNTLPTFIADAETGINNIDMMIGNDEKGIKEHPGLKGAVGPISSKLPTLSDDVADFETRAKQATGGAFLDAYNTLRGGGAITEVEGEKATAARSRMLLANSEKGFREAAKEYRGYIKKGIERAKAKAGVADAVDSGTEPASDELSALLAEKARRKGGVK